MVRNQKEIKNAGYIGVHMLFHMIIWVWRIVTFSVILCSDVGIVCSACGFGWGHL